MNPSRDPTLPTDEHPGASSPRWPEPQRRTLEQWSAYAESCGSPPLRRAILSLIQNDPEVLEAVDDVDGTLIQCWLEMTPADRMRYAIETAHGISEARHVDR